MKPQADRGRAGLRATMTAALLGLVYGQAPTSHAARPEGVQASSVRAIQMPERQVFGKATPATRVVVLGMQSRFVRESWPQVERRLGAELRGLGLQVTLAHSRAATTEGRLAELGVAAVEHHAIAAIRVSRGQGATDKRIQIWLYDALTGKMVFRQADLSRYSDREAEERASVRAVELLHASLIEVRMLRRIGRAPSLAAPPLVDKLVARALDSPTPPLPRWSLWGGLGTDLTISGVPPAFGVSFGASLRVTRTLLAAAEFFVPVLGAEVSDARGEAKVTSMLGRLQLLVEPWPEARLSPAVGLGLGGLAVRASGDAIHPATGRVDWTAAFIVGVQARLAVALTSAFRILGGLTLDLALPGVDVQFDADRISAVGRPKLGMSLALEWRWGGRRRGARR